MMNQLRFDGPRELADGLAKVLPGIGGPCDADITQYASLVGGENGHARLTSAYIEEVSVDLPASGGGQGLIPVKQARDVLKFAAAGQPITLEWKRTEPKKNDRPLSEAAAEHTVCIRSGSSKAVLKARSIADFFVGAPGIDKPDPISIPTGRFVSAVRSVMPCVATEQSHYSLTCLLAERDHEGTRLVATDGHRLILAPVDGAGSEASVTVPRRALEAALKAKLAAGVQSSRDVVRIEAGRTAEGEGGHYRVRLATDGWQWSGRANEGMSFPNYRRVYPARRPGWIVRRTEILMAVQRAIATLSAWTTVSTLAVRLRFEDNALLLSCAGYGLLIDDGHCASEAVLPLSVDSDAFEGSVGVDGSYLATMMRTQMTRSMVRIAPKDSKGPIRFDEVPDDDDDLGPFNTCVLMPIRI